MTMHSKNQNAERLLRLSDDMTRIAGTLAQLSAAQPASSGQADPVNDADLSKVSLGAVRAAIRARRLRSQYFSDELFADPAWDMLLELLSAELSNQRMAVSSLCMAAGVPATTALRWLKSLVEKGLMTRRDDPLDARRVFVELSPHSSRALRSYFAEVYRTMPTQP
jgi:DNA-binding MarR family transcriptional regulator